MSCSSRSSDPVWRTMPCFLGAQLHASWVPYGAGGSNALILKSEEIAAWTTALTPEDCFPSNRSTVCLFHGPHTVKS